jgi:hypothetical protein
LNLSLPRGGSIMRVDLSRRRDACPENRLIRGAFLPGRRTVPLAGPVADRSTAAILT